MEIQCASTILNFPVFWTGVIENCEDCLSGWHGTHKKIFIRNWVELDCWKSPLPDALKVSTQWEMVLSVSVCMENTY